ncbi:MAG: SRPBCC family protein [Phycisphaerae bacterium]|nr:SRPBCC family protein [Gemmatimonadaceae bacterium]
MHEPSAVHSSFTIERVYQASPDRIFAAFAVPETKRRWFAEGKGWELGEFTSDFRVGGRERSRFSFNAGPNPPEGAPPNGTPMGNDTVFLDIVPGRRIVFAYSMSVHDTPFSASLATIELYAKDGSTELVLTEQSAFFENSDGPELREQGWKKLLDQLHEELAR